jgi:predicted ATPase
MLPYQPILETLRPVVPLIRTLPLTSAQSSALARLLPDIFETENASRLLFSPDELRLQLFEAVLQIFIYLGQRQPILLIFEDMHWASESVLDWLTFIAPRLRENRMMVAITYRTDEVGSGHPLPRLTRRFEREDVVTSISLDRLSRETNREWVAHLSGLNNSSAIGIADRLYTETAGNPFFLQEIVRGMLETGQLQLEKGKWSGAFIQKEGEAEVPLPDSIRDTILARTGRLSEMARSFLHAAATAGRTFQYEIVAGAGGWADEPALNALEELRARGFVKESDPPGNFNFTHHLLREAIYSELTSPRRAYWHLNLAKSIQARLPNESASLAYHFVAAGEKNLGVEYARKAAQRAESLYAYEESNRYLQNALALLGNDDRSLMRLELLEALADSYRFLREGIEAISNYKTALGVWHARKDADKVTFMRLYRKLYQTTTGMWESTQLDQNRLASRVSHELQSESGELMHVIDEHEPHEEIVRLLKEMAVDSLVFHFPEDRDNAALYARKAVDLAERLGAPVALVSALLTVSNVYLPIGLLRERVTVLLRALTLCEEAGFDNQHLHIQVLLAISKSLLDVGEYSRAVQYLKDAETHARQIHAAHEENQALSLLHQCWFRLDRWDEMQDTEAKRRKLQEVYPLHRIGAPCFAIGLSSAVQRLMGNFEKAAELRDESLTIMISVTGGLENWERSQRY